MLEKHQYVRSKLLLKLVAALPCQLCGCWEGVAAAHSNWGNGKGRGIKADDNCVAALCYGCHSAIDSGSHMSKKERKNSWAHAHVRTVNKLLANGLWPDNVPLPPTPEIEYDA